MSPPCCTPPPAPSQDRHILSAMFVSADHLLGSTVLSAHLPEVGVSSSCILCGFTTFLHQFSEQFSYSPGVAPLMIAAGDQNRGLGREAFPWHSLMTLSLSHTTGSSVLGITTDQQDASNLARQEPEIHFCSSYLGNQ